MATKSVGAGIRLPGARPPIDTLTADTLTADELAAAMHDPLAYPGAGVARTSLLVGNRVVPMEHADFRRALGRLGAAPMAERTAILAVGSNGSAGRLLAKFGVPGTVIPILPVTVVGLRQGFAACVSRRGYVPLAPVAEKGARARLRILWLDPRQIQAIDESVPTHTRVHFDNGVIDADVYRSRFKVLRDLDGDRPMAPRDQRSLLAAFGSREWFAEIVARWVGRGAGPEAIAAALAENEEMRGAVRQGFIDDGLVYDDAL